MAFGAPQTLSAAHHKDAFDCGKLALNDWLVRRALQAQASGSAKVYVIPDGDRVAGYFALTVGQVDDLDASQRARKGMGGYPIPVVLLARMAVASQDQGQGIGAGMLVDSIRRTLAVAEQVGVRALMTHPVDEDAGRFYRRFGFEPTFDWYKAGPPVNTRSAVRSSAVSRWRNWRGAFLNAASSSMQS